jgi:hypothetical protein
MYVNGPFLDCVVDGKSFTAGIDGIFHYFLQRLACAWEALG